MTWIFKVKIGLSPDLMNNISEFIEKPYFLQINWQFRPEDPNEKLTNYSMETAYMAHDFFQINVKLSPSLWTSKVHFQA